jgi:hypothetical protein
VIIPPSNAQKGWDAGDLLKSGANRKAVENFMLKNLTTIDNAKKIFTKEVLAIQAVKSISMMKVQKPSTSRSISR